MAGIRGKSGGRRVGAGRPRLSEDAHRLRGTWREDRHGLRIVGATAPAIAPNVTAPPQPAALIDGLGAAGRQFMAAAFQDFEMSGLEAHVVRVAAQAYDDAEQARGRGDAKAASAAVRTFLAALGRLGPLERK